MPKTCARPYTSTPDVRPPHLHCAVAVRVAVQHQPHGRKVTPPELAQHGVPPGVVPLTHVHRVVAACRPRYKCGTTTR
eukprot:365616-Chlamydomonas_euryale.AAC.5